MNSDKPTKWYNFTAPRLKTVNSENLEEHSYTFQGKTTYLRANWLALAFDQLRANVIVLSFIRYNVNAHLGHIYPGLEVEQTGCNLEVMLARKRLNANSLLDVLFYVDIWPSRFLLSGCSEKLTICQILDPYPIYKLEHSRITLSLSLSFPTLSVTSEGKRYCMTMVYWR